MRIGLLIGFCLLLAGLSLVLNALFRIDLPLGRLGLAAVLLYLGGSILVGAVRGTGPELYRRDRGVVFGNADFVPSNDGQAREYSVLFGKGIVDLADLRPVAGEQRIKVNVLFGEGTVLYDPEQALRVHSSTAFADCELPNHMRVAFGNTSYQTHSYRPEAPAIDLDVSTVFGALRFEPRSSSASERDAPPPAATDARSDSQAVSP